MLLRSSIFRLIKAGASESDCPTTDIIPGKTSLFVESAGPDSRSDDI